MIDIFVGTSQPKPPLQRDINYGPPMRIGQYPQPPPGRRAPPPQQLRQAPPAPRQEMTEEERMMAAMGLPTNFRSKPLEEDYDPTPDIPSHQPDRRAHQYSEYEDEHQTYNSRYHNDDQQFYGRPQHADDQRRNLFGLPPGSARPAPRGRGSRQLPPHSSNPAYSNHNMNGGVHAPHPNHQPNTRRKFTGYSFVDEEIEADNEMEYTDFNSHHVHQGQFFY